MSQNTIANKTILDVLLERNRVTQAEVSALPAGLSNAEIEKKLIEKEIVSADDIGKAYAVLYDLPFIKLDNYNINQEAFKLIPLDLITKYNVICFDKEGSIPGGIVKIAIGSSGDFKNHPPDAIEELKKSKGVSVELYITTKNDINAVIDRMKHQNDLASKDSKIDITVNVPNAQPIRGIDLRSIQIPYDVITKFPKEISIKYQMVVFENPTPSLIKVAVANPDDKKTREILDFVRQKSDIAIAEFSASPQDIMKTIEMYYKKPVPVSPSVNMVSQPAGPSPLGGATSQPKIDIQKDKAVDNYQLPKIGQDYSNLAPAENKNLPKAIKVDLNKPDYTPAKTAFSPVAGKDQKDAKPQFVPQPGVGLNNEQTAVVTNPSASQEIYDPQGHDLDKFIGQDVNNVEVLKKIAESGNVPLILAGSIVLAVSQRASDIHIEPEQQNLRIRFRVDGVLRDVIEMPVSLEAAMVSRIKILSHLKIDETRVPQDGRFDISTHGHEIDLRVSTLPTVKGEKVALRILDKSQNIADFASLGITDHSLKVLEESIKKPYGIILSTGPTGSGKSTTLYSILKQISNPSVNVITLEDPVEYEMPGVNQCQIKPKIGFSFASGLRSVLRQDPNIIMVGEIRDAETASMATHAALTGHLVLTTLHTNDAAGALPRLTNMGIEPFLITSSINVVMAQRLLRKICPKCKQEEEIPHELMLSIEKELAKFNLPKPYKFYKGKGCPECNQGYKGRIGIYEALDMTDKIEDLAIKRRPASEIFHAAVEEGMITMKQDGFTKALKGITTVEEVLRVTTTG